MLRQLFIGSFLCLILPLTALAGTPRVAVDITPVHSLVSQVMQGVGKPDLIIQSGASPHGYSLRPSEAQALSRADVVFWIGEDLTPWLENSLNNLAGSAQKVSLLTVPGTTLHSFREGATFESHDHHGDDAGHEEHHEEHAHKDEHEEHHDEHTHKEKHDHHDKHGHEEEHEAGHHDGHQHGEHDPHAWLDPENAKVWLQAIAVELSKVDAANSATYQRNAQNAIKELDALTATIQEKTKALHDIKFIVFHDAYQYFERRFDLEATGAISLGDASDPSPARVKEIRDTVTRLGVRCVFTEPQYNPDMVRSVFESTRIATIGVIDPLGADIATGKGLYASLLEALVSNMNECKN